MKAKGIRYHKAQEKWLVSLHYGGRDIHLGSYRTFEDAVRAKRKKADKFHLGLSDEDLFGGPMSEILDTNGG